MHTLPSMNRARCGLATIISLAAIAGCGGGGDAADTAAAQADNVGLDAVATALAVRNDTKLPVYHVTDLGTLGGGSSYASAINDRGQVTGSSTLAGTPLTSHAFLYNGGALQDLGVLPPVTAPPAGEAVNSFGAGINNRGQVVGGSGVQAFLYTGGTITDLRVSAVEAHANDINDAGVIVGTANNYGPPPSSRWQPKPFLYKDGVASSNILPDLSYGAGMAINRDGQVTGYTIAIDVPYNPYYYAGTSAMILSSFPLNTTALAINDRGMIGGQLDEEARTRAGPRAYVATAGVVTEIGSLGGQSAVNGLNNAGDAVGFSELPLPNYQPAHAFLWTAGKMYDLNGMLDASGTKWTLTGASDINNVGQIVGTGLIGGKTHAFLLTPVAHNQHVGRYSEDRHISTALGNHAACQMDQAETLFPSQCKARSAARK